MLTKIDVANNRGTNTTLFLDNPYTGLVLESIDGLDPVDAEITSSGLGTMDGEQYQSSRRGRRNIIFKFDVMAHYTQKSTKALRKELYAIFMPKTDVHFVFHFDDDESLEISGRVESFAFPLFVKEPKATISIICFDPDFKSISPTLVTGNTALNNEELLIDYEGTTETGFIFRLPVTKPLSKVSIQQIAPDNSMNRLEFDTPLVAGDTLHISTISGAKSANRLNGENSNSVLYGVSPQADWLNLSEGPNRLRVYAEGAVLPFTIEYHNRYGGL